MIIKEFNQDKQRARLLTLPYQGTEHIIKVGSLTKSVRCSYSFTMYNSVCPMDLSHRAHTFWLVGALDRLNDNAYTVFKIKYDLFSCIRALAKNKIWGIRLDMI